MYRIYLGVGALLYLGLTLLTNTNKVLFLLIATLLLSFYGAGFATVPAYLRDLSAPTRSGPSTVACSPRGPRPVYSGR